MFVILHADQACGTDFESFAESTQTDISVSFEHIFSALAEQQMPS